MRGSVEEDAEEGKRRRPRRGGDGAFVKQLAVGVVVTGSGWTPRWLCLTPRPPPSGLSTSEKTAPKPWTSPRMSTCRFLEQKKVTSVMVLPTGANSRTGLKNPKVVASDGLAECVRKARRGACTNPVPGVVIRAPRELRNTSNGVGPGEGRGGTAAVPVDLAASLDERSRGRCGYRSRRSPPGIDRRPTESTRRPVPRPGTRSPEQPPACAAP